MKKFLSLALAFCMILALGSSISFAAPSPGIDPDEFQSPDYEYRPGVRWWWPGNAALTEDLIAQVDYLADNGFGMVEIVAFSAGFTQANGTSNGSIYTGHPSYDMDSILSYDSPEYYAKLEAVVNRCNERGIIVDLNMGSGYLASDDSVPLDDSQPHMALGRARITTESTAAIADIPVPPAEASMFYVTATTGVPTGIWSPAGATLCAVIMAEVMGTGSNISGRNQMFDFANPTAPTILKTYTSQAQLDLKNAVVYDASDLVDGKVPSFTPAKAAVYEIVALYSVPTGSAGLNAIRYNAAGERSYVADHFNRQKAEDYVHGWFGDPGLNRIVNNYNIRAAFNDSYEFWMDRYFGETIYAHAKDAAKPDGLLGYDITPFIPSFYQVYANGFQLGTAIWYSNLAGQVNTGTGSAFITNFGVTSAETTRITYDFNQMVNLAFQDGMAGFQAGLNSYDADGTGIKYRQQAYNPPIDTLKSAKFIDIPETEQENENNFRRVASGAHLYGRNLVTNEVYTLGNVPFNVTPQKIKLGFDTMAVGGVNNFFYHGLSATYFGNGTEDNLFTEEGWRAWPTIGVEMASTNVMSPYYKTMNEYATRANYVMQQGKPSSDVAVYMPLFGGAISSTAAQIQPLNRNGIAWDAINDDTITDDLIWNGSKLTNGIMEYSALVVSNATVPVKTMQALKALAEAGAPIILTTMPNAQPSYCGGDYVAQDALVGTLAGQIVAAPGGENIAATSSNYIAKILSVCTPGISYNQLSTDDIRLSRRALTSGGELAYIRNSNASNAYAVTLKVDPSLPNAYWLDQATGKIHKANVVNGSVSITVNRLGAVILLCEPSGVVMPASALSSGIPASIEQYSVLNTKNLTNSDFTLTVTSDVFNTSGGTTAGVVPGATETRVFTGTVLGNWSANNFQGNVLRWVSDPGVFSTKVQVDLDDYRSNRMILDLGTCNYAATVIVNGETVGQLYSVPYRIDITNALISGENEIDIQVQPLKINRRVGLRAAYVANPVANIKYRPYNSLASAVVDVGLTGPVNLLTVAGRNDVAVEAGIRANEASVIINDPASYTVSVMNATGAGVVELSFVFDGEVLAKDSIAVTPKNGFIPHMLEPAPVFTYLGAGMWQCDAKFMYLNNVKTNNLIDAVVISGTAIDYGPAVVTLTGFVASGDNGAGMGAMPSVIKSAEASVTVVGKPAQYSKYDLNQDGVIDEIDLLYLIYFYQWNDRDPGWATDDLYGVCAKDCDFQVNGKVDLADMIELTANYGPYDPYAW